MDITKITTESQVGDMLDWALAGKKPLEIIGKGTKRALGRPMQVAHILEMSTLAGIELYEPAELVMQAKAGSLVSDIEAELNKNGQQLAFEAPDYGPLLGQAADSATLGGLFNGNMAGSRRIKSGAARDHLLGVKGYTGRGQTFQAGSRVMKNVTGYDLSKLIAGSYGTLAIATSLTFKVLPKGEKARTVLIYGLDAAEAAVVMKDGMSSAHDVTGAAYLPANIALDADIEYVSSANRSVTALRLEGHGPSVEFRCAALRKMLASHGDSEELHGHNSGKLWRLVGNVTPFCGHSDPVWKISVPPSEAPGMLKEINTRLDAGYYLDWAGGLIWLMVKSHPEDGGAQIVRTIVDNNGHATLIRGSEQLRRDVAPFQPQNAVLGKISGKIKQAFDPENILNPGRMYKESGQ